MHGNVNGDGDVGDAGVAGGVVAAAVEVEAEDVTVVAVGNVVLDCDIAVVAAVGLPGSGQSRPCPCCRPC